MALDKLKDSVWHLPTFKKDLCSEIGVLYEQGKTKAEILQHLEAVVIPRIVQRYNDEKKAAQERMRQSLNAVETVEDAIKKRKAEPGNEGQELTPLKPKPPQSQELMMMKDKVLAHSLYLQELEGQEYHELVVAATTACYIWVPIVGWITGSVVAGVYGARRSNTWTEIYRVKMKLARLEEKVRKLGGTT